MKQCLFCNTVYADEFDKCPNCAKVSYKSIGQEQEQKEQEQIDLTKMPKIKNPNVFLVFGIIICVFFALASLCFII